MKMDIDKYDKAILAKKYRKDAKEAYDSLRSMPRRFRELFLAMLQDDPKRSIDEIVKEIQKNYDNWVNPYESKELRKL